MSWIEDVRVCDRAGEERRLLRAEIRRRLVEVAVRGGIRAPDAVPPFDHVQIQLEDALLRQLRLEASRDEELAQLSQRIFRRGQVQVLRKLLRDRARTAHELAP